MTAPFANRRRGEVAARIDGRDRTLCLTLGALAELEAAFAADNLIELAERFETGRLSAADIIRIIACGLRGAGESVSDAEVAAMRIDGGAAGFARIAADLLGITFGAVEPPANEKSANEKSANETGAGKPAAGMTGDMPPGPENPPANPRQPQTGRRPFPGTR